MKIKFHFLYKNILVNLYYRFNFLGMMCILIIAYATKLIFLDSLLQYTPSIAGWNKLELVFLLYTMILSLLISDTIDSSVLRFFQKVYHGEGDVFFIKPISLLNYMFLAWAKTINLIPIFIMTIGGLIYFYNVFWGSSLLSLLLYLCSFALGIIINVLLVTNLSCLTFIIKRQIPADFLFSEFTKIMILPMGVFSRKVGLFLLVLLPSIFSAAVPAAILLKSDYSLLKYQSLGFVLSLLVFYMFYKYSLSRYEGLGG